MSDKRRRTAGPADAQGNVHMGGESNGAIGIDGQPDDGVNKHTGLRYSRKYYEILESRKKLPIYDARVKILRALKKNQVIVLEGETGSGKTTQVPQLLVEADYVNDTQIICCTQPRRVAAINVAKRVAEEMDVELGKEVGYSIRWDDKTDKEKTILKYLTDGMLLREAMNVSKMEEKLKDYSVIVLDEAHERTLSTDILLGLLKNVLEKRTDLKLIVMSATLDAHKFQDYFDGAPLLKVPGRMYPVEEIYSSAPEDDYVKAAIRTAIEIHRTEPPGDILIFLTGEEEIEDCVKKIQYGTQHLKEHGETWVLPLYSSLPPHKQQLVFKDPPQSHHRDAPRTRKIICSTNVAETSLTIDGVVYVIDPGFAKQKIYNPRVRVESLLVQAISRASAKQRAGRAGRTRPGKCFRLYTKESFQEELTDTAHPEILRSNLGNVVLTLKTLGIDDLVHFDFMDPPAPETLMRALEQLNYLGALDDEGELTKFGEHMAAFPLAPELSACLINSQKYNCSADVLSIVAMLANGANWLLRVKKDRNCDEAKRNFDHPEGDHLTLLNVYNSYKRSGRDTHKWCKSNYVNPRFMRNADHIREQLSKTMKRRGFKLIQDEDTGSMQYINQIKRALLSAFYQQVAFKTGRGGQYITCKDQQAVVIHPSCGLSSYPQWVFYNEFVYTKKQYIRTCTATRGDWLLELAPHYFDLNNFPAGDCKNELVSLTRKRERRAAREALTRNNNNSNGVIEIVEDEDEDEHEYGDEINNNGRNNTQKHQGDTAKSGRSNRNNNKKKEMNRKGRK